MSSSVKPEKKAAAGDAVGILLVLVATVSLSNRSVAHRHHQHL
jgi:hypothetical protein